MSLTNPASSESGCTNLIYSIHSGIQGIQQKAYASPASVIPNRKIYLFYGIPIQLAGAIT